MEDLNINDVFKKAREVLLILSNTKCAENHEIRTTITELEIQFKRLRHIVNDLVSSRQYIKLKRIHELLQQLQNEVQNLLIDDAVCP